MTNNPKIILIGGAPYTGKSTTSLMLGNKLNIKQIVDIDVIREVLRGKKTKSKYPYLYYCSTTAWEHKNKIMTKSRLIQGYKNYCKTLYPSIKRIIDRAYVLGKDVIIEGVHILPSLYKNYLKRKNLYIFILFTNGKRHIKNLEQRKEEFRGKRIKIYQKRLPNARIIQEYLIHEAKRNGAPCIDNEILNHSVNNIISKIVGRITWKK